MENKQIWPGWDTIRVIGSGGFGKVYEIHKVDTSGEYRAALKVISIPSSQNEYESYKYDGYCDENITEIFKSQLDSVVSEFALMSQFKGVSNIVSYEDHMIIPHEDGIGWDILIRMELLTSLPVYMHQHSMDSETAIAVARDICRALSLCEKKNIVHRDIKPQNIFVNEFGDFKLGDFGIARTMEHTNNASKTGTYHYMAPEVYRGERYNNTVDLYSLGLVLYWLLNERKLPFLPLDRAPTASEIQEMQFRRMSGEPLPPPKNGTDLLNAVIQRACALNPSDRYQSAAEMLSDLGGQSQPKPIAKVCPWCQGSGHRNVLDDNLSFYTKVACSECNGTGHIEGNDDHPALKKYNELLQMSGSNANPDCDACHGLGWLTMRDGHPYPCMFCTKQEGNETEGLWGGNTEVPEPPKSSEPPKQRKRYCIKCGTQIEASETVCAECKKKEEPKTPPKPNMITCPHCQGTKIQTFLGGGGFVTKYYDDTCGVCGGRGQILNDARGAALQKSYAEIRRMAKVEGIASNDCPVCHGLGQIISRTPSFGSTMMTQLRCPRCFGKKVKKIDRPKK